jgi:hypothetical protein
VDSEVIHDQMNGSRTTDGRDQIPSRAVQPGAAKKAKMLTVGDCSYIRCRILAVPHLEKTGRMVPSVREQAMRATPSPVGASAARNDERV